MKKLLLFLIVCITFSCSRREGDLRLVPSEKLFSMNIGMMEDELNLFHLTDVPFNQLPHLYMYNGLFYISNGRADKVTRFTSFGDVITMYYNPTTTPAPVIVQTAGGDETVVNRVGYPVTLNAIQHFVVNSRQELLVVDRLPKNDWTPKPSGEGYNAAVIRRIGRNGEVSASLGQEGLSGSPFPYVEKLELSLDDQISVICRTPPEWEYFRYNASGALLYHHLFSPEALPEADEVTGVQIQALVSHRSAPVVYLYADYYRRDDDDGLLYSHTRILAYDLEAGDFVGVINVYRPVIVSDGKNGNAGYDRRIEYSLKGTDRNGYLYLVGHLHDRTYEVSVLDAGGQILVQAQIEIERENALYTTFHLAPEGVLSALVAADDGADVVWWRFDSRFEEVLNPASRQ